MKTPYVNVIMPVYNARRYVAAAIDSVLKQTFSDFELIVVDDGSTDGSGEEVAAFRDSRIILLTQPNSGYPAAMNLGLSAARGEYIARMDADDLSTPERLGKQVAFLDSHPEMVFVGCRYRRLTPNGRIYTGAAGASEAWVAETWDTVLSGRRRFADPSVMFRKAAAAQVGNYRTYQRSGQDVDLWLRLLEGGGEAATLNEFLYIHRMHPASLSQRPVAAAMNKIPRLLAQERRRRGTDAVMRGESTEPLVSEEMLRRARQTQINGLWDSAQMCLEARDFRAGMEFILLALRHGKLGRINVRRALVMPLVWLRRAALIGQA